MRPVLFQYTGMVARIQRVLWMTEFLNTETHTRVLLMKYLWSPHSRDVRICVSTVLKLTSRKTDIARSARGLKSQGLFAEDALAEPYLVHKNFGGLQQITMFLVKVVNLETIIDMQSWCRTWPPNGSSRIREKTKTSQETQRSLQKFLEPDRKPQVIYTDNSLEFGKSCQDLSWNHCTSTTHRSETNGIAERAVRRVKDGTSAVWLQ